MGVNQYITLCQFLTVKDLSQLSQVSKLNYLMLEMEETWMQKWQNNFSSQYEQRIKGQTYKIRCINAYRFEKCNSETCALTFSQLVRQMFTLHVYQTHVNFPQLVRPYLSLRAQQNIFKNYQWNYLEGYGPQDQLPGQEDQDEEFLRMTNQVRRQKQEHTKEIQVYVDHLFVRPV